tara:strand:+ start:1772 stop:2266 length:495 start_codon:yes stop_codon:yes gene_type:complete
MRLRKKPEEPTVTSLYHWINIPYESLKINHKGKPTRVGQKFIPLHDIYDSYVEKIETSYPLWLPPDTDAVGLQMKSGTLYVTAQCEPTEENVAQLYAEYKKKLKAYEKWYKKNHVEIEKELARRKAEQNKEKQKRLDAAIKIAERFEREAAKARENVSRIVEET